jgi:hypothetical protein
MHSDSTLSSKVVGFFLTHLCYFFPLCESEMKEEGGCQIWVMANAFELFRLSHQSCSFRKSRDPKPFSIYDRNLIVDLNICLFVPKHFFACYLKILGRKLRITLEKNPQQLSCIQPASK